MTEKTTTPMRSHGRAGVDHAVLLYNSEAEFLAAVTDFAHEGLAAGEPVLVAAPGGRLAALRAALTGAGDAVTFVDSKEVGANPARLIPAYRQFVDAHRGRRLRMTGELLWPGRSAGEITEVIRHEALLNLEFADEPIAIHCLYDANAIDSAALAGLERAHPVVIRAGQPHASEDYDGPGLFPFCDQPLAPPPADCLRREFDDGDDLPALRWVVASQAADFGLAQARIEDLVVAVSELAANALVHGGGRGVLRIWRDASTTTLSCEVTGPSHIADQLAGRHLVPPDAGGGHGLWMVNQLCDLVELRSHATETTIRVHLRLDEPSAENTVVFGS